MQALLDVHALHFSVGLKATVQIGTTELNRSNIPINMVQCLFVCMCVMSVSII